MTTYSSFANDDHLIQHKYVPVKRQITHNYLTFADTNVISRTGWMLILCHIPDSDIGRPKIQLDIDFAGLDFC